ncbi:MAG: hypothetical protein WC526_00345 [Patescibacteria group bacterium]
MISIPLYIFLIIYFIFLFIFAIFFITNLLHIVLTGTTTFSGLIVTLIIICLSLFVVFETWNILQNIDWNQPIIINFNV